MRGAIIACTLISAAISSSMAMGQENPSQPRYVYIAQEDSGSSSWSGWKMPSLWPTGLGSRIAAGTTSTWNSVKVGTSRAWTTTRYTLAPWSKPKPQPLTGSRGFASSKPKKSTTSESSWWPKLDFWNSESESKKKEELKTVGDWQDLGSPAEGF
jgi:hypothetical protein